MNWRVAVADFRLRIGFAKTGLALWLSHLEVVRCMERCIRRSNLPYAISQGFSPHMKHTFTAALPVGTGSIGEYMDVELESLVAVELALRSLQAVQHPCLPVLSVEYAAKDAPSLQVYFNRVTYLVELARPDGAAEGFEGVLEDSACAHEGCKDTRPQESADALEDSAGAREGGENTFVDPAGANEGGEDTRPRGSGGTQVPELLRRLEPRPTIEVVKKAKRKSYDLESYVVGAEAVPGNNAALRLSLLSRPEGSLRPEVILAALGEPDLHPHIVSLTRIALEHQEL